MVFDNIENNKGCFVKDIKDTQVVKGCFLVSEVTKAETRAGKPFLTIALLDKSGEITGRVWDNADQLEQECSPGTVIFLTGQAQSYRDNLQLNIKSIEVVGADSVDWTLYLPSSAYDKDEMFSELKSIALKVEDQNVHALFVAFFNDDNFVKMFKKAPAAKNMHHAYLGGLLEHTLGVVKLSEKMAGLYPEIDNPLLVCGAVLHDIGKIKEFSFEVPPFNYSDQGRLVGHMVLAIEMIQEKIASISGFPSELATRIKHLILSHHGRHEFGSPSLPMIREAFVLNFIDDLDAKMNYINGLSAKIDEPNYQWTPFQRTLERFLFVPGHFTVHNETNEKEQNDAIDKMKNMQPTLW